MNKMIRWQRIFICGLAMIALFLESMMCLAQDAPLVIVPSIRKKPIAIPLFMMIPEGRTDVSNTVTGLLAQYLDFTGYFKILDRSIFPDEAKAIESEIDFEKWKRVGAELLVTGSIRINGNLMEMEMRLFDPIYGKLLLGKRYSGFLDDYHKIIRRFCEEIIHTLTGFWGIFESKIAFVSTASGKKEIYICDFDGTNIKPFTNNKSINFSPAWSSDGKWIAYTSYRKGKPDIYIENVKQKIGFVVDKKGINSTPAWSPNAFEIAVTMSFSGDPDIYLLNGKGVIIKKLTSNPGIDESPAWSPDGTKIAFVSGRSGSPQIYIMDVASGQAQRLTFKGEYNTQPCWSPRGDKIVYSAMVKNSIDICVIGVNDKQAIRLTSNIGWNESPSWSPDGSMIVFSSNRDGAAKLYVMTAFGTDQRQLLTMPGEQSNPDWSPRIID